MTCSGPPPSGEPTFDAFRAIPWQNVKTETLQALLVARLLHASARELCNAADRYLASAGLLQLQDALELVLYASLLEIGRDDQKPLENLRFDELLAEVRKQVAPIPKSSTLRALNRERVNIKHFGQVADPVTVSNFFAAATSAIHAILRRAVGRTLDEIMLHELLKDGAEKSYIRDAIRKLESGDFRGACVDVRKALYIGIEEQYSIEEWIDYVPSSTHGVGLFLQKNNFKAPFHTRNAAWIQKNVREPLDYIQIDSDRLRMDLLEWGIPPRAFNDLRYLTPRVFRFRADPNAWVVEEDSVRSARASGRDAASFCIDQAVFILAKRQSHIGGNPLFPARGLVLAFAGLKEGTPIRQKADLESEVVSIAEAATEYMVHGFTTGFDRRARFARVTPMKEDVLPFLWGYVPENALLDPRTVDLTETDPGS
jgi:hypothetical protein